jgi:hypothetical protein
MLKTIPPRVIPKTIPLRVMPQGRPPRVISQRTPLRVVGVGENCRQGVRRAEDLHVPRHSTGGRSPRVEAGLLTRRRRRSRCGDDRHRSNRGCKQRYVVVQPLSHDPVSFDMLGGVLASSRLANYSDFSENAYSSGRLTTTASCVLRAITITAGLLRSGFSSRCGTYGGTKM